MAFARERRGALIFGTVFGLLAYASASGYRHSYPTLAERLGFARSFGSNPAVRLFYGLPHDLLSVGGFTAWRAGGMIAIVAGTWGALAGVRQSRGEEEAGRADLVLSAEVGRGAFFAGGLTAIAAGAVLLWLLTCLGLVAGGLPAGGSAFLALAAVSPALAFAGAGMLLGQFAPDRRRATELAAGAVGLALLLRVIADTSEHLSALRWASPLGWAEELRPFAGSRPSVLLLPVLATTVLAAIAALIQRRRDIGRGLLASRDSGPPRLGLLGSPTALAFRGERGSLLAWNGGIGGFALVVGLLTTSFSSATISAEMQRQLARVGGGSITTPTGALGFYFLFFILVISLFACSQIAGLRHEEAGGRLETLFTLTIGRRRWLAGRLGLALAGIAALAVVAGTLAWAGASIEHAHVPLTRTLEAGANCLPASLLFLALGALAFAVRPRASAGLAYAVVGLTFSWELLGGLLGAPAWLRTLSPFHNIGLVPAQPFRPLAAGVMLALAAGTTVAAVLIFERRDVIGA